MPGAVEINTRISFLIDRAALLAKARSFFAAKKIIETDCQILSPYASVDAHIDLMQTNEGYFLHTSPEYAMKRLLADGMPDCYYLGHVFRKGEFGRKHCPEFTMAEWYRLGFSFADMISETIDFIRLFVGHLDSNIISYREAFIKFAGIDYFTMSTQDLVQYIKINDIKAYDQFELAERDDLLNLILAHSIEPNLGSNNTLTVLAYYPASQAALAKKQWHHAEEVAERFEVYLNGIELANGYHELTDAVEQRMRLEQANKQRHAMQKNILPIDELFLNALLKGLPPCSGVAVGFDRLMLIRQRASQLDDILPIPWSPLTFF